MSNARNLSKFKPSSSGLVETADIADDAVSTDQIANDAVISTSGAITTTGAFTSVGIDDNADGVAMTIDTNEDVELNNGGLYVTGSLNSLTVDKGGIDRSGNTTRIISGRSGGNYADLSINIAGTGNAVNRQVYIDYQGNVTLDNGNLTIGTSGKGIDFSATGNTSATGASTANELFDDYEEGSWTPVMDAASNGGTVVTTHQGGQYTKIGREIKATFQCVLNSKGSGSGNFYVKGLPYVTGSGTTHYGFAFGYFSGTNDEQRGGWAGADTSYIRFNNGANMDGQVQLSELTNGYYITGSFFYFTDS